MLWSCKWKEEPGGCFYQAQSRINRQLASHFSSCRLCAQMVVFIFHKILHVIVHDDLDFFKTLRRRKTSLAVELCHTLSHLESLEHLVHSMYADEHKHLPPGLCEKRLA